MGAAIAVASSRVLSSAQAVVVPGPLPESLAITFAALAVLLGWVVVVGLAGQVEVGGSAGRRPPGGAAPTAGRWRVVLTTAVHRLLRRGSWLTATLTVLGALGVGMITVLVRSPDNPLVVLQGASPLPQLIVLVGGGPRRQRRRSGHGDRDRPPHARHHHRAGPAGDRDHRRPAGARRRPGPANCARWR